MSFNHRYTSHYRHPDYVLSRICQRIVQGDTITSILLRITTRCLSPPAGRSTPSMADQCFRFRRPSVPPGRPVSQPVCRASRLSTAVGGALCAATADILDIHTGTELTRRYKIALFQTRPFDNKHALRLRAGYFRCRRM